jgi:hypothetical protein
MEIINIVCSHSFNNLLKKIPDYTIDLGRSYTKRDEIKNTLEANIKDIFVLDFFKEYNILIFKVGILGAISIYSISNLQNNEVIVYKKGKYHKLTIDLNMAEMNIEKVLAEVLWSLEKTE